jgi:hypothetical protein
MVELFVDSVEEELLFSVGHEGRKEEGKGEGEVKRGRRVGKQVGT